MQIIRILTNHKLKYGSHVLLNIRRLLRKRQKKPYDQGEILLFTKLGKQLLLKFEYLKKRLM